MPHFDEPLRISPLAADIRKATMLGAEAILPTGMPILDLEKLSAADKENLRNGVFKNGVVVVRNQQGLDPATLPKIAKIFDETAWDIHSGGEKMVTDQKNILAQNRGARIPRAPQVSVIGKGKFVDYEGLPELDLKHVDHTEFHEDPHSVDEIADGFTRPYRWHMDAPLYERLPGVVTTLHSILNPSLPDQKIRFPHGEIMNLPAGATAFFSGARAFELLSDEEKAFALNTTVQYAPRAYEWMRDCKATEDGLTIAKKGREKKLEELEEWSWDKVHSFPMVWRNPYTQLPHLQVLGCCVHALHTRDPSTGLVTTDQDLDSVRKICHDLLGKVYKPENIYAHRWHEGDLVIFHNRGVLHSITGQLGDGNQEGEKKRLFWQCSMASGTAPMGFVNS
ncbi:alpha-ketoglutarate dependent xanthine dioxygenase [Saccharata proteae CBS 121410]|uniref:Alpha-ketoglutarate dependent xanthine dioxygenase n=1 Tax=Saccharata proteae CBS 121410 TaxID=1314787 RepID=A0A9P4HNG9_9PEZI|nr:alpha-ketoglutarate dependent xanthine dioxygenase [Saccharata proteae CBS 121410]